MNNTPEPRMPRIKDLALFNLMGVISSPCTTNSDHIQGAGATARRQCKPSLTPSHSPGRNRWPPPDVGQMQPFRHPTGQLSDQVAASTVEHIRSRPFRLAVPYWFDPGSVSTPRSSNRT